MMWKLRSMPVILEMILGKGYQYSIRNNKTEQISYRLNIILDYLLNDLWDNK
jgi:hypothetical protein